MFPEILVYDVKWEMYSWLATHVSLTNIMDLYDWVLEFIIGCKFSERQFFFFRLIFILFHQTGSDRHTHTEIYTLHIQIYKYTNTKIRIPIRGVNWTANKIYPQIFRRTKIRRRIRRMAAAKKSMFFCTSSWDTHCCIWQHTTVKRMQSCISDPRASRRSQIRSV